MRYLTLLLTLASLLLAGCNDQLKLKKAAVDTIVFCADKPAEVDGGVLGPKPGFRLHNTHFVNSQYQDITLVSVGDYWCFWGDQLLGHSATTVTFEPLNEQASSVEEFLLWGAREGAEIKKVVELAPELKIDDEDGVFRMTLLVRHAAPVVIIEPDHTLKRPDI